MNKATILVIFGATGDLMAKKITPALYSLFKEKQLPQKFKVIGFARRDFAGDKFYELLKQNLVKYLNIKETEIDQDFYDLFTYHQGQLDDQDAYRSLNEKLIKIDKDFNIESNKFFYFSVAPEFYEVISTNLSKQKLKIKNISLIIEKPFGKSEKTALELDNVLKKNFSEEQIFRIDHYLGKQMINKIPINFNNDQLTAKYKLKGNIKLIKNIEITTLEELGVEARGDFYDPLGALRDVGQNHLLEIISLIFIAINGDENNPIERDKILQKLRKYNNDEVKIYAFRAQYKGYKNIENIKKDSVTETYFKIIALLDLNDKESITTMLQAGKRIGVNRSEIRINLINGDTLVYDFKQLEELNIISEGKIIKNIKFQKDSHLQYVGEYAELLKQAINYQKENFVSINEVISAWKFIDPIENAWQSNEKTLKFYAPDNPIIIKNADEALNLLF